MAKLLSVPAMVLATTLLFSSPLARAQQGQGAGPQRPPRAVYDFDFPNERPLPAPVHDISGIWEPAANPDAGTQAKGAQLFPSSEDVQLPANGRPEGEPPYTALGWEAFLANKPSVGATMVLSAVTNDPVKGGDTGYGCDPTGFPRLLLYNFRTSRIIQTPENVVILYMFNKKWRVIPTDGQELPKEFPESRWFGYSVGRWEDNYTFVVHSGGIDDRTWLDAAGRPHSDALQVEERYQRTDRNHLMVTVIIDDPKMYTKPWTALHLSLRLQSPTYNIGEMECAPSEIKRYNDLFANPAAGIGDKGK
jgi:hypothetical protein